MATERPDSQKTDRAGARGPMSPEAECEVRWCLAHTGQMGKLKPPVPKSPGLTVKGTGFLASPQNW